MVAQILLHPVSGRNTSIITRRQSQAGSSQYNSTNPYSPSGRSCRGGTVTDLVSRAPTSGNRSIKGIMGMDSSPGYPASLCDSSGFRWLTGQSVLILSGVGAGEVRPRPWRGDWPNELACAESFRSPVDGGTFLGGGAWQPKSGGRLVCQSWRSVVDGAAAQA